MWIIKKVTELRKINKFKKTFEANQKKEEFEKNIQLCNDYISCFDNKNKIETVKLFKCYTFLCLDKEEDYKMLSNEIHSNANRLMILYYNLILQIDTSEEVFKPLYDEFVNYKFKVNGSAVFFSFKIEIDALRDAIINKHKISKKSIENHLKKTKIAKLKKVFEIIDQYI